MPIRVIAGSAKGRKLKRVPGDSTRPVMDRVKEALFNILGVGIHGCSFLDLFAGTGSIGIEALSRGAARVVFIDRDRLAIRTIVENLELTRLSERAEVQRADSFAYLQRPNLEPFEYIYVAPPQYKGLWKRALILVDENPACLYPDGITIVQIDPHEREDISLDSLHLYDERTYGRTLLLFYERSEPESADGEVGNEEEQGESSETT